MPSFALLPNLAGGDGLILLLTILLYFAAKKLPDLARGLGTAIHEFRKAKDEIEETLTGRVRHSVAERDEAPVPSPFSGIWRSFVRLAVFPSIPP